VRQYVIRRLLLMLPLVWAVGTLVFILTRVMPGDAAQVYVGISGDQEKVETLRELWGLNDPKWEQYTNWWTDLAQGDLGISIVRSSNAREVPVTDLLKQALPVTLELSLMALLISMPLGVMIGIISAVFRNGVADYAGRFAAVFFLSVPNFWVATLMVVLPAIWFGWTPARPWEGFLDDPLKNLSLVVWPAVALGLSGSGVLARLTRSTMLETLTQDYVRTARAKGLQERVVIMRHALRNSLIPVVALASLQVGAILGGTVIIEQIFALPGMGRLLLTAIGDRDYNVVQAITMIAASWFMLVALAADILYGAINPRIRFS